MRIPCIGNLQVQILDLQIERGHLLHLRLDFVMQPHHRTLHVLDLKVALGAPVPDLHENLLASIGILAGALMALISSSWACKSSVSLACPHPGDSLLKTPHPFLLAGKGLSCHLAGLQQRLQHRLDGGDRLRMLSSLFCSALRLHLVDVRLDVRAPV